MSDIVELIVYDLDVSKKQAGVLRRTLRQYTLACEEVALYADRKQMYGVQGLSAVKRAEIQRKYGLPSGVAECVVRRVGQDFTALNPKARRGSRRPNVPDYTDNNYFLCSKDTASVLMEQTHPADDFTLMVSLSVLKGRLRVPFRKRTEYTTEGQRWHNREMRVYSGQRGETWTLEVARGDTEGIVTDFNPDYEEPDWEPDEAHDD